MKTETRPLYLNAHQPLQVRLDGPALRVTAAHSDDRRYPLRRLSRIVVSGEVRWTAPALLACGHAGVVLCFVRPDGLPRRCWVGRPSTRSTFVADWKHFLDRPSSHGAFLHWRRRVRLRAIRLCTLRLGLPRDEQALTRHVGGRTKSDPCFRAAKRTLYGLAYARSLEELAKLGFSNTDRSLGMVLPDLVATMQWALHASLCDRRNRDATKSAWKLVALFERHRHEAEFCMRETLTSLARLIGRSM